MQTMQFNKLSIDQNILNLSTYICIIIIKCYTIYIGVLLCVAYGCFLACFYLICEVKLLPALKASFRASLRNKIYVLAVKA